MKGFKVLKYYSKVRNFIPTSIQPVSSVKCQTKSVSTAKLIAPGVKEKSNHDNITEDVRFKIKELNENLIPEDMDNNNYFMNKISSLNTFISDKSGLTEVRNSQNYVIMVQAQLAETQEKRRAYSVELADLRREMQKVNLALSQLKRGEPEYVDFVRQEIEIIQDERHKLEHFQLVDSQERELFMHFCHAIRMSHEKEKIHTNKFKTWTAFASLIGAILGVTVTYLNSRFLNKQVHEIKSHTTAVVHDVVEKLRGESWYNFTKRKTVDVYRYFVPK